MQPIEAKVLGQQVSYPKKYSPEILVAVPRALNREIYKLNDDRLPFTGCDIWHAYELSFLTLKGLPVAGLLKIKYAANSKYLVESKSLKLYLNSFNMERYGNNALSGVNEVTEIVRKDLTDLLKCDTEISFFNENTGSLGHFDFEKYEVLENSPELTDTIFNTFNEAPNLLISANNNGEIRVSSHLLRSNCKITNQPDWGSVFIKMNGKILPDLSGLLKYLVSIRNENHFHEEICEMIYKRLWDKFSPDELMVACIYTRRGGIDICPVRVSHERLLPKSLCNAKELSRKLVRQ